MAPPSRSDVIQWIKNACASLSTTTISGGFKKTKLLQAGLREAEDQPSSEINGGELIRVLQQECVPMQAIDSRKDIEESEVEDKAV
ncbi:hypothetical protein PF008_g21274 [Phytophthora fragariae]|uniref:Uncharacterized protein n=1 Tax=Phytophthora fragariae TaxID=53985 RepID=A0A6G0QY41_9STRA|nr:hypothetical protein PF008_g21274 [Phytophthora fragariae]